MWIDITHHKRAGKGLKKPYLAFVKPDGRGGVQREFVRPIAKKNNWIRFAAELRSGDIVEFRHFYWGEHSHTTHGVITAVDEFERVMTGVKPVGVYTTHPAGGMRWLALIGNRRMALNGDQAMQLARRPMLAGEIETDARLPERIWPEPMWPGVHFDA